MTELVRVDVLRNGRQFEAEATMDLAADAPTVWGTITDYGALPRFMPGIRACRVIERRPQTDAGEQLVVEQRGEFRFLFFAQAMTMLLHIDHEPLRMAQARAVRFDFGLFSRQAIDVFVGRYELTSPPEGDAAARTRLRYAARIGLRLSPPPAIGDMALRQNLATQLQALSAEVLRRSRLATATPAVV
jgi:hypothetical protein